MAEDMSYLQELALEKDSLDPSFVHAQRLLLRGEILITFLLFISSAVYLGHSMGIVCKQSSVQIFSYKSYLLCYDIISHRSLNTCLRAPTVLI